MPKITEAQKLALHGGPAVTEATEHTKFWKDAEEHATRAAIRQDIPAGEEVPEALYDDVAADIAALKKVFTSDAVLSKAVAAFYATFVHEAMAALPSYAGHPQHHYLDPSTFLRGSDESIYTALYDGWEQRFGKVK